MKNKRLSTGCLLILSSVVNAALASYDFSNASQLDEFDLYAAGAGTGRTNFTHNAGEFVRATKSSTGGASYVPVMLLDSSFSQPSLTVQTDFRFNSTSNFTDFSIGIYFAASDAIGEQDSILSLFTARTGGTTNVRFRQGFGGDPTLAASWVTNVLDTTVSTGAGGQPPNIANNTWYTLKLDYEITGDNQVMSTLGWYTQGGGTLLHEVSHTLSAGQSAAYLSGGKVGIRGVLPGAESGTLDIDNFTVIPEPSTLLLTLGALATALIGLRRRHP